MMEIMLIMTVVLRHAQWNQVHSAMHNPQTSVFKPVLQDNFSPATRFKMRVLLSRVRARIVLLLSTNLMLGAMLQHARH